MNIVLLGAPGSGKGTQAKILSEKHDLIPIATGDILRGEVSRRTKLGNQAQSYLDKGELVPDEVVIEIIKKRLENTEKDFILDGFPRNLAQAQALEEILRELRKNLEAVFYFEVSEEELIKRLVNRRVCLECGRLYHLSFNPPKSSGKCDFCGGKLHQRSDDKPEAIKKRLVVYLKATTPLSSYYRKKNLLRTVKAEGSPQEISKNIQKLLFEAKKPGQTNDYSEVAG